MHVLIIGLGLIGGSIAKALKKHSDWTVSAYNKTTATAEEALKVGAIDSIWYGDTDISADIIVICLPPKACVSFLKEHAGQFDKGSVVTDVCGIKQWIVAECGMICCDNGLCFVGGHPMAGKERSGFRNSDENLFNRASYILTPVEDTDEKALDTAKHYAEMLKCAKITVTDPKTHDRMIAFTSQLPHVIAGAYVKSPSCLDRKGFSAGSFKDVSRVATVDENLWTELFLENRDMLLPEIDCMIANLEDYRKAIENNDAAALSDIIKKGRIIKENDIRESEERK